MTGSPANPDARHQHLAILLPEYLDMVLDGTKTVECRLTRTKAAPFRRVEPGELIWLKESCGPVRGVAHATDVLFLEDVSPARLRDVRMAYGSAIQARDAFWVHHGTPLQCSLITLDGVLRVEPFLLPKRDRRAWVVLPGRADDRTLCPVDRLLLQGLLDRH